MIVVNASVTGLSSHPGAGAVGLIPSSNRVHEDRVEGLMPMIPNLPFPPMGFVPMTPMFPGAFPSFFRDSMGAMGGALGAGVEMQKEAQKVFLNVQKQQVLQSIQALDQYQKLLEQHSAEIDRQLEALSATDDVEQKGKSTRK
jgi:hypothetical protein